jgi:hypothetical protein
LAVGGGFVGVNVEIIQRKAHALDGVLPMAPHAGRTHHGGAFEFMEGHRGEDLERLAQPRLIGEEVVEVTGQVLCADFLERRQLNVFKNSHCKCPFLSLFKFGGR